jgi:RimJ/RimL family protein N-acetyltransferase
MDYAYGLPRKWPNEGEIGEIESRLSHSEPIIPVAGRDRTCGNFRLAFINNADTMTAHYQNRAEIETRGNPTRLASGGCVAASDRESVTTERLLVRLPREADRDRFVELFCNADFMVFYSDVLTAEQARDRFDHMVAACQGISFGKQPVVELSSGLVVGYTGVDYIDFEGQTWLEWGYRLVPERRGLGYATEASQALLAKAHQTYTGKVLAVIAPENFASQNVCRKLGFRFWKQALVDSNLRNLYTLSVGEPAA